ncbi:unnamed protein product [Rhizoctonia solani]|uniref:Uncharacterized protein n=1 Tax=Rhizoctonia solani TaxID=456999 RepID=A0A8H3BJ27_9AGAM|nr:unnamed protein product [Rhizoctonia solani]
MLRELRIAVDDFVKVLSIMKQIMPVADGLEYLRLWIPSHSGYSGFLELFVHTPKLQIISLANPRYVSKELMDKFATMYPKVRIVWG